MIPEMFFSLTSFPSFFYSLDFDLSVSAFFDLCVCTLMGATQMHECGIMLIPAHATELRGQLSGVGSPLLPLHALKG